MARLAPKADTLRALFARSGNQCAFPGCTQSVVNSKNKFIAQVCHIEAASEGGERFNTASNDEYRRSYDNLVIFCYPHHIETDDTDEYTTECLRKIKLDHEQQFLKSDFKIDEAELQKLVSEMQLYWSSIDRLNQVEHYNLDSGLAMEVNGQASFDEVIADAHNAVSGIEALLNRLRESDEALVEDLNVLLELKNIPESTFTDVPYYQNPFENRNWESHNLGTPNWLLSLRIALTHIEVKYLSEYLKTNSNDNSARNKLDMAKQKLESYAVSAMHVD
ncbi:MULTISPECIES: hypothetical protein [Vibrio]|uniref:hypothetical protein n=1 Tax=Vibrio TaxID=662 RepID=UPI00155892FA|nr:MULTISPECIES: hypothetical protein [Vibrio]EID7698684.1 hypothetical protein [Vibrio parahaemolyticus]EJG1427312.1 hypothetical protein [Vibrio parahaemolyticus]ELI5413154.1 hypothetical protein [Vibrio parahaemolyticus]HAV1399765.1 hypothetical protein [Vibrio parahaemolyticus]